MTFTPFEAFIMILTGVPIGMAIMLLLEMHVLKKIRKELEKRR